MATPVEQTIFPNQLAEDAVALTTETTYYSTGITPDKSQGAMGVIIRFVPDSGSPPTAVDILAYVQTAEADAAAGTDAQWTTFDEVLEFTSLSAGILRMQLPNITLDKLRIKFDVADVDGGGVVANVIWCGNLGLTAL